MFICLNDELHFMRNSNTVAQWPTLPRAAAYLGVSVALAWVSMMLVPRILGPVEALVMFGTPVVVFTLVLAVLLVFDSRLNQ